MFPRALAGAGRGGRVPGETSESLRSSLDALLLAWVFLDRHVSDLAQCVKHRDPRYLTPSLLNLHDWFLEHHAIAIVCR